jgi:hypothetical protein
MRAAPACTLTLTPGRFERWISRWLLAAAGASLGAWGATAWAAWRGPWDEPGWVSALWALIAAGGTLSLANAPLRRALAQVGTTLTWTGQDWLWAPLIHAPAPIAGAPPGEAASRGQAVQLAIALDLGPWLLLRAHPRPDHCAILPTPWAPAAQWRHAPADWHAMRVAWTAHAGKAGRPTAADSRTGEGHER